MNNMERNKINKYINKGEFDKFIKKYKFEYQSFIYYCKHTKYFEDAISILDYVIKTNNLGLMIDVIIYLPFEIPEEYVRTIVDIFYEEGNRVDIRRLCDYLKNIDEKQSKMLLNKLISLKAYEEVSTYVFNAKNADKLTAIEFLGTAKDNSYLIKVLEHAKLEVEEVNEIIDLLEQNYNCDFIKLMDIRLVNLAHEKVMNIIISKYNSKECMKLLDTKFIPTGTDLIHLCSKFLKENNVELFIEFLSKYSGKAPTSKKVTDDMYNYFVQNNDPRLIYMYITKCYYYLSPNMISLLKEELIKGKNKKYIAKYILFTKDYALMTRIFIDTLVFYLYCKQEGLLKEMKEIEELFKDVKLDKEKTKYIDSNINEYVLKK